MNCYDMWCDTGASVDNFLLWVGIIGVVFGILWVLGLKD